VFSTAENDWPGSRSCKITWQRASRSDTGRPSIDPELLLRIMLIGYLYGIRKAEQYSTPRSEATAGTRKVRI
jgi:hypothetical protein